MIVANDLDKDVSMLSGELDEHFAHLKAVKELSSDFEKDLTFAISNKKRIVNKPIFTYRFIFQFFICNADLFCQIYSPTGPLNRDFDDVRRIAEASERALKK